MGRSRYIIHHPQETYFLTDTIVNWIPIFTRPATVDILLNSWRHLQMNHDLKLYGFVVLENHIHWIAQSENLPKDILRFKSYSAKMIIRYLEAQKQRRILRQLAFCKKAHKTDRQYQLWEEGSHPQLMQNDMILREKLEYIHLNPVKRGYVDRAEDWRYSSARNYVSGTGLIEVFRAW